jgi:hypothetical protein
VLLQQLRSQLRQRQFHLLDLDHIRGRVLYELLGFLEMAVSSLVELRAEHILAVFLEGQPELTQSAHLSDKH